MILESVKKGVYTFDIPEMKKISPQLKDLIYRILQPESLRLTIDQIYQHPWMNMEESKLDFRINYSKIINFSKYSKVNHKIILVKNICSNMHCSTNVRSINIKNRSTF